MASPVVEQCADPIDAETRLAQLAYSDALTGLPNRARLADGLHEALEQAGDGTVILLSIDLDDFKLVNDGLGHAAGDELLRQLAARLDGVRRPGDLLGRQGGDEFLLIVRVPPAVDAATAAGAIGDRISAALESPFHVADAELRIGASIGAALYPHDAADAEALHQHADSAMYDAKEGGGGYARYRPRASDPLERLSMAAALRRGLQEGALSVHYQPIFRLPGRELIGVEALARWTDPVRGPVSPVDFVGVAEKTGVIHALGEWVLQDVCRTAAEWARQGLRPNIGINLSPRQLERAGFAADVVATVAAHGIEPGRVVFEITESAWLTEIPRTLLGLQELIDAGFTLALDDFGAGYSSLARLRRLPVKVIKIDRSFMTDLPADPQAAAIVQAILALANACHCDVVTEGVETEAQLQFLCDNGCRLAQGFGLGRPQPLGQITDLLARELVAGRRD